MYSLLRGLYDHFVRRASFNIVIVGLDNAGKTVRGWGGS